MARNAGFTLVEVAIVLVIIGLLASGILKGMELIDNARFKRTISDIENIEVAIIQFEDVYGGLPGDLDKAQLRLAGCEASHCVNGNGDNLIGRQGRMYRELGTSAPENETFMFWKHMALAGLISNVDPQASPSAPATGSTHPQTPYGGAYVISRTQTDHFLFLGSCPAYQLCMEAPMMTPQLSGRFERYYDGEMDTRRGNFQSRGILGPGCEPNFDESDDTNANCLNFYLLNF